jgi:TetR/AcrR family transcriptional repressor of mexAB-oprM operon
MALFGQRGFEHTTVAQIAKRAGVSRAAIFWHFGDKATLFGESCQQFFRPFREQLQQSLLHIEPEKRMPEIFAVYDRFVGQNRVAIQAFVRWVLESHELRSALQPMLLELHEQFRQDVRVTLEELMPPGHDADVLASGLVALLDGNLLLGLVDPDPAGFERRSAALRAVAGLVPLKKTEK